MTPLLPSLSAVAPLPTPLKRGRVSVPPSYRFLQSFDKSCRGLQVLSRQRPPDEDALDRFGEVQPRPSKRRVKESDPPIPAPPDDFLTVMAFQIVPDQYQ